MSAKEQEPRMSKEMELMSPKKHAEHEPTAEARERLPVALRPRGLSARELRGAATRFDDSEMVVQAPSRLALGSKVAVRLRAPRTMAPFGYAGMRCRLPAQVTGVREISAAGGRYELLLKWQRPLPELIEEAGSRRYRRFGVLLFAMVGVTIWFRWNEMRFFWYDPILQVYSATLATYFLSRFFLTLFHRPPKQTGYEPTVSIVISVRNEEKAIAGAVTSCYEADYPHAKREVIVVNDGSTDGTAAALRGVVKRYPDVKVFEIPPGGKRAAMAKGIREATGEIVVVVDSDTILERSALKHIVCGFEDRTLGASSGYTAVANADVNFLTRMQDVRYLVSYELMKAPESVFGCVSCCPGCLSAYRREYLLKILDEWLGQTFLGARATFGDDRSLTNYILRDHRAIYNPLARSSTLVPDNWKRYMRQQCRWKKSWLREAPIAGRILAGRHPVAAISFYASAACSLLSPYMAFRYVSRYYDGELMGYVYGLFFLGVLMALFASWKRPTRHWYITWYWIASQVFLMGPQTYYAMLTMRKNHWGTR